MYDELGKLWGGGIVEAYLSVAWKSLRKLQGNFSEE
jgi:hypothetical protein